MAGPLGAVTWTSRFSEPGKSPRQFLTAPVIPVRRWVFILGRLTTASTSSSREVALKERSTSPLGLSTSTRPSRSRLTGSAPNLSATRSSPMFR